MVNICRRHGRGDWNGGCVWGDGGKGERHELWWNVNNLACRAHEYLLIPECFWEPWRRYTSDFLSSVAVCWAVRQELGSVNSRAKLPGLWSQLPPFVSAWPQASTLSVPCFFFGKLDNKHTYHSCLLLCSLGHFVFKALEPFVRGNLIEI